MTTEIKIGIGIALLIVAITWWNLHDRKIEKAATLQCVEAKTETKKEVVADNVITIDQHNQAIAAVVKSYAQQMADRDTSIASLSQRLHDAHAAALPANSVRGDPGRASGIPAAANDSGPSDCDRREAVNLEACAANTIELSAIRDAWHKLSISDKARQLQLQPAQ